MRTEPLLEAILGLYSETKYIGTVSKHGYRFTTHVNVTVQSEAKTEQSDSDLRQFALTQHPRRALIIGVLPFAPRDNENSLQCFGDGLAEQVVHALSRLHGLKVTACGLTFRFRGAALDLRKVCAELGADLILSMELYSHDFSEFCESC